MADFVDTFNCSLSNRWDDYLKGKIPIQSVLAEYKNLGFDANQDIPGNYKWEELYDALPADTKVILTVRDSEDVWWNSWVKFLTQETERGSCCGFNYGIFFQLFMDCHMMGPAMSRFNRISTAKVKVNTTVTKYFSEDSWISICNSDNIQIFMDSKRCYQ